MTAPTARSSAREIHVELLLGDGLVVRPLQAVACRIVAKLVGRSRVAAGLKDEHDAQHATVARRLGLREGKLVRMKYVASTRPSAPTPLTPITSQARSRSDPGSLQHVEIRLRRHRRGRRHCRRRRRSLRSGAQRRRQRQRKAEPECHPASVQSHSPRSTRPGVAVAVERAKDAECNFTLLLRRAIDSPAARLRRRSISIGARNFFALAPVVC